MTDLGAEEGKQCYPQGSLFGAWFVWGLGFLLLFGWFVLGFFFPSKIHRENE